MIIQGMFIVSLPYAVFHGGYWAILAMVGIAYICCYTGKILVDCLYETNEFGERTKVRYSYNEVAQEVFGELFLVMEFRIFDTYCNQRFLVIPSFRTSLCLSVKLLGYIFGFLIYSPCGS